MRKEDPSGKESLENQIITLIVEEIKGAMNRYPELKSDLKCVVWGGSRVLEKNGDSDTSDIDIVTLLSPHRREDPFNLIGLTALNEAFRKAAQTLMDSGVVPVIVATIRLEDAEITMAEILHPDKKVIPIHWLFYPSPEFGLINEPPKLLRNLVQGEVLIGEDKLPKEIIRRCETGETPTDLIPLLGGLDWLTDTFRLFETNTAGQLPRRFLVCKAAHDLEYFFKWRVCAQRIEQETGNQPKTWKQMAPYQHLFPPELWNLTQSAILERRKGSWSREEDIRDLYLNFFRLWPRILSGEEII
jgi:hypothetical protein